MADGGNRLRGELGRSGKHALGDRVDQGHVQIVMPVIEFAEALPGVAERLD